MKYVIEIDLGNFTEEEILSLAKYRGYKTEVAQLNEETNRIETVDNTQTPEDYLAEKGQEYVSNWLSERLVKEIKSQSRMQMNQLISNAKSQISTCLTISKVED